MRLLARPTMASISCCEGTGAGWNIWPLFPRWGKSSQEVSVRTAGLRKSREFPNRAFDLGTGLGKLSKEHHQIRRPIRWLAPSLTHQRQN